MRSVCVTASVHRDVRRKTTVGVSLYRTILHQGAALAPVLPELRADVRDQILLVISEPVLSKKILALQMRGTDSHGWGRKAELGHVLLGFS
jgi:hypothetical protein